MIRLAVDHLDAITDAPTFDAVTTRAADVMWRNGELVCATCGKPAGYHR